MNRLSVLLLAIVVLGSPLRAAQADAPPPAAPAAPAPTAAAEPTDAAPVPADALRIAHALDIGRLMIAAVERESRESADASPEALETVRAAMASFDPEVLNRDVAVGLAASMSAAAQAQVAADLETDDGKYFAAVLGHAIAGETFDVEQIPVDVRGRLDTMMKTEAWAQFNAAMGSPAMRAQLAAFVVRLMCPVVRERMPARYEQLVAEGKCPGG